MPGETNSKQIEDFTLKIIGARPDRSDRLDCWTAAVQANFQTNPLFVRNRKQVINHLKPGLSRIPVHTSHVGKEIKGADGILFQKSAGYADVVAVDMNGHLIAVELYTRDGLRIPAHKARHRRMVLQFL